MIELERIELMHNVKLPEDYKNHMLNYNGGEPAYRLFFKPNVWGDEIKLSCFLPIKYGDYIFEEAPATASFYKLLAGMINK